MGRTYHPLGRLALAVVALALTSAPWLAAQSRESRPGPRYDMTTEATVSGTVQSVEQVAGPGGGRGRRGLGGTHLELKTADDTLVVHLGPTAYLSGQKVLIAAGDTVEIVGSRVTVDGDKVFIARVVKKGDQSWTLRDAAGRPLWRGRGR